MAPIDYSKAPQVFNYEDEDRGFFFYEGIDALPFNHWKSDRDWVVFIYEISSEDFDESWKNPLTIIVEANTPVEACDCALYKLKLSREGS